MYSAAFVTVTSNLTLQVVIAQANSKVIRKHFLNIHILIGLYNEWRIQGLIRPWPPPSVLTIEFGLTLAEEEMIVKDETEVKSNKNR